MSDLESSNSSSQRSGFNSDDEYFEMDIDMGIGKDTSSIGETSMGE